VTRLHATCPRNRVSIFGRVLRFIFCSNRPGRFRTPPSLLSSGSRGARVLQSISFDFRATLDKILLIAIFLRMEYSGNIEGTSVNPNGYIAYVAVLLCHIIGRS
jgi:hypothetical protein